MFDEAEKCQKIGSLLDIIENLTLNHGSLPWFRLEFSSWSHISVQSSPATWLTSGYGEHISKASDVCANLRVIL